MSVRRVAVAEQPALDGLAEQRQDRARQLDGELHQLVEAGQHDGAALADRVEAVADDLGRHQVGGEDRRVGHWPRVRSVMAAMRLPGGGEGVRGAELLAFSRLFSSGSTATTFFAPA